MSSLDRGLRGWENRSGCIVGGRWRAARTSGWLSELDKGGNGKRHGWARRLVEQSFYRSWVANGWSWAGGGRIPSEDKMERKFESGERPGGWGAVYWGGRTVFEGSGETQAIKPTHVEDMDRESAKSLRLNPQPDAPGATYRFDQRHNPSQPSPSPTSKPHDAPGALNF